jgi:two-component system response regulator VicR
MVSATTVPTAPKILLVEDEAALAESVSYNLLREGYAVITAVDGERALDRFRADRPSIVVLDLMLPKLSGLDVCRAIRRESDVPILILTAKDSEADKVAGLELGADDYVTLPFSMR